MISIDWTLFVQMAIFLAFVLYLNFFLLRPMAGYLGRRKDTVSQHRNSAEEKASTLAQLQKGYEQKISSARDDLLSQRTAARKEALSLQNSILEEAKKESLKEVLAAESDLQKEILSVRERLAEDSRVLASNITRKILGRSIQ